MAKWACDKKKERETKDKAALDAINRKMAEEQRRCIKLRIIGCGELLTPFRDEV